ncbi:MAG TPA: alpha/beta hydrolase [Xanthobacteraceae bacterium]|nr:alpha/beta hydrolase [Xanthobacteraceae bacterium]
MPRIAGVTYSDNRRGRLTGDLYLPDAGSGFPIIIAIHGGGWKAGSAGQYRHWGNWLASRGVGILAINYRLVNETDNRFPAQLEDVCAAVKYVRAQAHAWGAAPDRIALMGDSAGAHLAALAALGGRRILGPRYPDSADLDRIRAVIGIYGVYDMLAQWEHDLVVRPLDSITERLIGASPLDDAFPFIHASPMSYVRRERAHIPFFVGWGEADDVVDWASQSRRFVSALKRAGNIVRIAPVPGAAHFWMRDPIEEPHGVPARISHAILRFTEQFM